MPTIPMDDVQVRVTRGFLERVTRRAKHGPGGRGDVGPCNGDCVKCEARRLLDDPAPEVEGDYPVNLTELQIIERFARIHWRELREHLDHEEQVWRERAEIGREWRLEWRDGVAYWVLPVLTGANALFEKRRPASRGEIATWQDLQKLRAATHRCEARELEIEADQLAKRAESCREAARRVGGGEG